MIFRDLVQQMIVSLEHNHIHHSMRIKLITYSDIKKQNKRIFQRKNLHENLEKPCVTNWLKTESGFNFWTTETLLKKLWNIFKRKNYLSRFGIHFEKKIKLTL